MNAVCSRVHIKTYEQSLQYYMTMLNYGIFSAPR